MTREERIKAFTMRIDGHNWQEIAREIGYADCTIKNDLSACIRIPPRPPSVLYPVIRKYIVENYGGVVKSWAASHTPRHTRCSPGDWLPPGHSGTAWPISWVFPRKMRSGSEASHEALPNL